MLDKLDMYEAEKYVELNTNVLESETRNLSEDIKT